MKNKQTYKKRSNLAALSITLFVMAAGIATMTLGGHTGAAPPEPFTDAFLRLDSLTAQTWTGGRVCFKPSSAAVQTSKVVIVFPTTSATDYQIGSGTWNLDTNDLDSWPPSQAETALPDLPATGTMVSATKTLTVTLSSAVTLATTDVYCFNFSGSNSDQTLETSSAGATETTQGTISTEDSTSTVINQTIYSESIITNNAVVVSAIVPPIFNFALSGNTDSFTTNLSTSSIVSTGGRNITITTNAPTGWIVWAQDLNGSGHSGALQSVTAANYKISGSVAAPAAARLFTVGSEDYGMGVTINTDASGGGTVSVNGDYDGTANKAGTLDPSQFQPIASSNGTADGDIINEVERATIAGQTPAASDYTDTIYFVGAGVF